MKYNRSPKESVQRARAISRAHKVADNSGIDYPVSTQRASLPRVKLTAKLTHIWQKKVKGTCADFVCAGTLVCPCLELPHNQSRIKGFNASQFSLIDIYFKLNSQKLPVSANLSQKLWLGGKAITKVGHDLRGVYKGFIAFRALCCDGVFP